MTRSKKMAKRGRRGPNPETFITNSIRGLMHLMRIPHFKHWGGPFSAKGVSDLIGTLPKSGGRALFCEVKTEKGKATEEQLKFLSEMEYAGALTMVVHSPEEFIEELVKADFEPAKRISLAFSNRKNKQ